MLGFEGTVVWAVDACANEVRGDKVWRELDALEGPTEHLGNRLHGERFREAGHTFDEEVATRKERDEDAFEHLLLSHDDTLDFEHGGFQGGARFGDFVACGCLVLFQWLPLSETVRDVVPQTCRKWSQAPVNYLRALYSAETKDSERQSN